MGSPGSSNRLVPQVLHPVQAMERTLVTELFSSKKFSKVRTEGRYDGIQDHSIYATLPFPARDSRGTTLDRSSSSDAAQGVA